VATHISLVVSDTVAVNKPAYVLEWCGGIKFECKSFMFIWNARIASEIKARRGGHDTNCWIISCYGALTNNLRCSSMRE
jgi:hypothetical protein